jgi:hypothetical protein
MTHRMLNSAIRLGVKGKARWCVLLAGLTLVRGLIYTLVIPPWQAPDETGHFEYAATMAALRRVPSRDDVSIHLEREMLSSVYEWRLAEYMGRPAPDAMPERMGAGARTLLTERFSLAYVLQSAFVLPFLHQDIVTQLLAARTSSVLLQVCIVLLAFWTFIELTDGQVRYSVLMATALAFLPQHTFINSAVGEGPAAELLVSVAIYCWVRLYRRGYRVQEVAGVIVGTVLGCLSKRTAWFLVPADLCLALWWLFRSRRRRFVWAGRRAAYLLASVAIAAAGLHMLGRSGAGTGLLASVWSRIANAEIAWVDSKGVTAARALIASHNSFWANFGWMALQVGQSWYCVLFLLSVGAVAGWLARRSELGKTVWKLGVVAVLLACAFGAFLWAAILSKSGVDYQPQGRYLFPVATVYVYIVVEGCGRLLAEQNRRIGHLLVLVFLISFDTWCLANYILPYYYA